MFSIWIGGRPSSKELHCMEENNVIHGLTLIASENWIKAKSFIQIDALIHEALADSRVQTLWNEFPEPMYRSDILRLWYLLHNPNEVYVDSDCLLHSIPK